MIVLIKLNFSFNIRPMLLGSPHTTRVLVKPLMTQKVKLNTVSSQAFYSIA